MPRVHVVGVVDLHFREVRKGTFLGNADLLGKYGPSAELQRPSRRWAKRRFLDIRYWNEPERGGHFAAFERPKLFVDEVRAFPARPVISVRSSGWDQPRSGLAGEPSP
jgi:hypothetical protein